MGAVGGEELTKWEKVQGEVRSGDGEEKILVLVRLKPLSEEEVAKNNITDWECINENTILFRNSLQERPLLWIALYLIEYLMATARPGTFMRKSHAKEIALSVQVFLLMGKQAVERAYGQTSSGKNYQFVFWFETFFFPFSPDVPQHEERGFVLKFCAMEIYNEKL
ncbi:hypothetical protein RHGRI_021542 [Rhododendron griersonianum]|uniref:Uncharacterized protein n=1 Tax=Rhododendron griersonianum TaxID=479676 RepID=A0AAV6JMF7_9ERIC|nr:hypothetical protein RHGRI_021542 [Rhododendron griersonianum]